MRKLNLIQSKWYTNLLNLLVDMVERRREFDLTDRYIYRHSISQLDHEIKILLPIFRDEESIFPKDRKEVYQTIKNFFNTGRWDEEFIKIRDDVTRCFEMDFICDDCGDYRAIEPMCNKCYKSFPNGIHV